MRAIGDKILLSSKDSFNSSSIRLKVMQVQQSSSLPFPKKASYQISISDIAYAVYNFIYRVKHSAGKNLPIKTGQ